MSRVHASEVDFTRPPGVVDGAVMSAFRVPPEAAGQRLDIFLRDQLHRTSRTRAQWIVRASAYDTTGRKLDPNHRVQSEQRILLWRPPWDDTEAGFELPVLYEDEHLLAIDKPALLPVHPTARYYKNTVIKLLQAARPESEFLSLAHRLDRETSGVMLISKTRACDRAVKRLLENRVGIEKWYVALTWGIPDRGDGAKAFRHEQGIEIDSENPLRVKMRASNAPGAQHAATFFEVRDVRTRPGGRAYAWVHCALETGRQHQIRLHLTSLGAAVVGDKLYGPDERAFARAADGELTDGDRAVLEMERHALHAARLSLPHPMTGERLVVEAPVPNDMAEFWASLTFREEPCRDRSDRAPRE